MSESTSAAPAGNGSKLLATFAAALLAAAAAGGGVYWFTAKSNADVVAEEEGKAKTKSGKPKGPAIYVEFDPPFVVNFEARGMTRFLQVTLQVMTRDPLTADLIKQHDPVIRNDLLLLLSSQTYDTISTREGKDALRTQALQVVSDAIEAEGGKGSNVEQLYFTSFVMQ
jgi:flagellar FliL protein